MISGFFGLLGRGVAAYDARLGWGPWLASAATFVIFLLAAAVSLVICEVVAGATGFGSLFDNLEAIEAGTMTRAILLYGVLWTVIMQGCLVVLTVLGALLAGPSVVTALALVRPSFGWAVIVPAFFVLAGVIGIYSVGAYVMWPETISKDLKPFRDMMAAGGGLWLVAAAVIGAPLSEELLFRGFLLSALARTRFGFIGGALITNVAWTLLHAQYSLVGLGAVFLVGLVQSWLLWRTGSLWVPIICHALYNAVVLWLMVTFFPTVIGMV